jgi:two-component system phosphate regulon sensor histidine kinase PhoR
MWGSRTFWRIFGTYSLLLLCAIVALALVIPGRMTRRYQQQMDEKLRGQALLVLELIKAGKDNAPPTEAQVHRLGSEIGTRITLLDRDGRVLADTDQDPGRMDNHLLRPEIQVAKEKGIGGSNRLSTTLGKPMQYVALRADGAPGGVGFVRVAVPADEVEEQLGELTRGMWLIALFTAAASTALAFWLARRITRPLLELMRGTKRIAAGEFGQKVYLRARDEIGALTRTFNDMSEQLARQFAELEEDRQQLRTILSSMVEGVVALDADQGILFVNERAALLLGIQPALAPGRKLWELVRQRALQQVVERALQGADDCRGEVNWDGVPGRSFTIHAARLPGSSTRGAVLVLHDTTELRRLERIRQEFVANVSHELKTPLSVIKACAETLLDGAAEDPVHRSRFLEQIEDQSNRLQALIMDLLSLARIESAAQVFEFQTVHLEPLVLECLDRNQARAKAKMQRLEAVAPNGRELTNGKDLAAWADEDAVGQILDNLVDNALKYTPEGGRVAVSWRDAGEQVCLEVQDTGIGIPEQDLPRIFERFYRVDKARSRELGGTGLGLSIVKHLSQAMQGSVRASSRLGKGTTFQILLPRAPCS